MTRLGPFTFLHFLNLELGNLLISKTANQYTSNFFKQMKGIFGKQENTFTIPSLMKKITVAFFQMPTVRFTLLSLSFSVSVSVERMPIADMICGNIFMVVLAGQGGTKIWLASPGSTGQQDLIIMGQLIRKWVGFSMGHTLIHALQILASIWFWVRVKTLVQPN